MDRAVIVALVVAVVLIAVYVAVRWRRADLEDADRCRWLGLLADDGTRQRALAVLADAYADGRLSLAEYERRRDELTSGRMMPNREVLELVRDLGVTDLT